MTEKLKFKSDAQVRREMEGMGYCQERNLWQKERVGPNADVVVVYVQYVPCTTRDEVKERHVGEYMGHVTIKRSGVLRDYVNISGTCFSEDLEGLERDLKRRMREYGKFILDMFGGDDADH